MRRFATPVEPPSSAPHFSADPFFEIRHIEVDEQTDPFSTESQISHELRLVQWQDGLDRLDFDNHRVVDEQINPISELELESVVLDG